MIHVFGDSHSIGLFGRAQEATIHHLGAWTMHRVGRDGAEPVVAVSRAEPGDDLVFVFGEVDVRAHLTRPVSTVRKLRAAEEVAQAYLTALSRLEGYRVYVVSVLPPAYDSYARSRAVPVFGSIQSRVALTRRLNFVLSTASQFGLHYLDIFDLYSDGKGALRPELSDGHVHVGEDHVAPAVQALSAAVGKVFTLSPGGPGRSFPTSLPQPRWKVRLARVKHNLRRFGLLPKSDRRFGGI